MYIIKSNIAEETIENDVALKFFLTVSSANRLVIASRCKRNAQAKVNISGLLIPKHNSSIECFYSS